MFEESMVVQSAISSFNNVAIAAPSFFWSAVLMLPLFALVYFYGNDLIAKSFCSGLSNPKFRTFNFSLCIEALLIIWLVVMHGNYAVLRETSSVLPFVIAGTLFILTASFVQKLKTLNPPIPAFWANIKRKKLFIGTISALVIAIVGFSGSPTWFGFLLQSSAVICGAIIGRRWKNGISPILFTSIIMLIITTIIFMQPEFFRFGQLGNLTILHLLFILIVGALGVSIIALRNVNPRKKIRHGVYVKLKWLMRISIMLFLVLFVLTESVPVFIGLCIIMFISAAMSVWHLDRVPENLSKKLWAIMLCVFGIMISLPMITAFGILYFLNLPDARVIKQSKFLL